MTLATPMRALLLALLLIGTPGLARDAPVSGAPVRTGARNGIEMAYRGVGAGEPPVLPYNPAGPFAATALRFLAGR